MEKRKFLKLTTDLCYIIEGYFERKIEKKEIYKFMNDDGIVVFLDLDKKMISSHINLDRLGIYALHRLAIVHKLKFELYIPE